MVEKILIYKKTSAMESTKKNQQTNAKSIKKLKSKNFDDALKGLGIHFITGIKKQENKKKVLY